MRLLAATRLAGDEVGGAGVEVLLRGFVGRGGGEKLQGLEVVRLHLGMVRGGGPTTGEEEDREDQDQLSDEGRQVTDDALGAADVACRRVLDEFLAAVHQNEREENREGEEHPAHEAVAFGGAAEDFRSGGRRGAGHDGGKSERPNPAGNPAVGRFGVTLGGLSR